MPNSVQFNDNYPDISKSLALYEKATKIMPPPTQTLAKGPGQYSLGAAPIYLKNGKGCRVWDVDGNEFIDWNAAIGPLSLGYAYPAVDNAIKKQLEDGITFSLMHELEYEVPELICHTIPNAEAVRISKTGADVCSAAIRVARAFTQRNKILCCGYHGWHDWYVSVLPPNAGIPADVQNLTYTFDYNNLDSLKNALDNDVAAVIMEPYVFDEPKPGYLQEVKALCEANGTIFILDEMWSGFRIALGGAQEYFNIKPDLAVYSKAVANGMPVSFITGRADVMAHFNQDVFFYTTFGGEALSLAAVKATINELKVKNVPAVLAQRGQKLKTAFNTLVDKLEMQDYVVCKGFPCRTTVALKAEKADPLISKSFFQQEMIKRGILWQGNHNITYSHTDEDINYTLKVYGEVLPMLKNAIDSQTLSESLIGRPLEPVFRKTEDFNVKPVQTNK